MHFPFMRTKIYAFPIDVAYNPNINAFPIHEHRNINVFQIHPIRMHVNLSINFVVFLCLNKIMKADVANVHFYFVLVFYLYFSVSEHEKKNNCCPNR